MKDFIRDIYENCGVLMAVLLLIVLLALLVGAFFLEGLVFMWLWNWLAVDLLGAPVLSYLHCVGINFAIWWIAQNFRPKVKAKE